MLRANEDVEMVDVEDDEIEEEAVLDELDGNVKPPRFFCEV